MTKMDFDFLRFGDLVVLNELDDSDPQKECVVCYIDTVDDMVLVRSLNNQSFKGQSTRLKLVSYKQIDIDNF